MARAKMNKKRTAPKAASARPARRAKIAATRLENGLVSMKEIPEHLVDMYITPPSLVAQHHYYRVAN
jgi:hypothetical protein